MEGHYLSSYHKEYPTRFFPILRNAAQHFDAFILVEQSVEIIVRRRELTGKYKRDLRLTEEEQAAERKEARLLAKAFGKPLIICHVDNLVRAIYDGLGPMLEMAWHSH